MILAGGLGTRLASLVPDRSKVVAEAAGRPFIYYLLDQLSKADFRKVVLCTGHQSESVEKCLGSRYKEIDIFYSCESGPMGTAGAARLALPLTSAQSILVMNGDSFCDISLAGFYERFSKKKRPAAMVLAHVSDTGRFGRVSQHFNGDIRDFLEKDNKRRAGWINAGIYLMRRQTLESLPVGRAVSFEQEVFPQWLKTGFYGYRTKTRFLDIGTIESYNMAGKFFSEKKQDIY